MSTVYGLLQFTSPDKVRVEHRAGAEAEFLTLQCDGVQVVLSGEPDEVRRLVERIVAATSTERAEAA